MRFARIFVHFSMSISALFVVASAPAPAQEPDDASYYMTIFSAQADSRDPRRTHCFATFVKAIGTGDSAKDSPATGCGQLFQPDLFGPREYRR